MAVEQADIERIVEEFQRSPSFLRSSLLQVKRLERQREAKCKQTVKHCTAAEHMSMKAHAVYEQLVAIAKREPEYECGLGLFAWDSQIEDLLRPQHQRSGLRRHVHHLESEGWCMRISEMFPDLEPPFADGWYVFDHTQYVATFPGSCAEKLFAQFESADRVRPII